MSPAAGPSLRAFEKKSHFLLGPGKDTLIGTLLEPWRESRKRKAVQTPKFY